MALTFLFRPVFWKTHLEVLFLGPNILYKNPVAVLYALRPCCLSSKSLPSVPFEQLRVLQFYLQFVAV